jgi:hypothetical protein
MKKLSFKIIWIFGLVLMLSVGLQAQNNSQSAVKDTLVKVWETSQDLRKPECVFYDAKNKVLYVSSISGEVEGDGFISKIGLDSKIIELKWISGLNNPKGMCIYKHKLYVADKTEVVEIDIKQRKIVGRYTSPDIKSLNDIAIDKKGVLYISETNQSYICRLKDKKVELWITAPYLKTINGMLFENDRLVVGTSVGVYTANLKTAELTLYIDRKGFIDGLSPIGDGRYLVSNWAGNVTMIEPKKEDIQVLNTVSQKINQADFFFVRKSKMLYSPTFNNNSVIAYRLTSK